MRSDKDIENELLHALQALVEQGVYEYYNNEKGKLMIRNGKNFDKRRELPLPKTVAGKTIKWTE